LPNFSKLELDSAEFRKRMKQLKRQQLEIVDRALGRAGMLLLRDAVLEPPTVPHREGTLRGSGSVHVEIGGRVGTSQTLPGAEGGQPANQVNVGSKETVRIAVIGFNTPYAARLHEHPEYHFREESAGGKYLESKMLQFKEDYFQEIADAIKEALNHA